MTQNAIRMISAGVAIAAAAAVSLAVDPAASPMHALDPSVPSASQVFHANDGKAEGNVEDRTY